MAKKIDPKVLRHFREGKYNFFELKQIIRWFEDPDYENELRSSCGKYWEKQIASQPSIQRDLSPVLESLKTHATASKRKKNLKRTILHTYFRIAAVLLIPLIVYSGIQLLSTSDNSQTTENWILVESPHGSRTHFQLPDGSKVSLNGGTNLTYNMDFVNNRTVKLEGEAYFDVIKNPASPFLVEADRLAIEVLGTQFSVTAFSNEQTVDVILESGKVKITKDKEEIFKILSPNEGFFYDKAKHSGIQKTVDSKSLTAWKDGFLIFRSDPFSEVLKRIGRYYNVKFKIEDSNIKQFSYRATFHEESLHEILRLIELTAPIKFEIETRSINPQNNTYENLTINVKHK